MPPMDGPNPYTMRPHDAAILLNVHRDTVVRWANEGKLPFWRTPGNQRRFRREDVEALLRTATAA